MNLTNKLLEYDETTLIGLFIPYIIILLGLTIIMGNFVYNILIIVLAELLPGYDMHYILCVIASITAIIIYSSMTNMFRCSP